MKNTGSGSRDTKDDKVFLCTFCNSHKSVALSNMGERALKSHMKGEKHQKVAKLRQSAREVFFMSSRSHAVNRQNLQQSSSTSLENRQSSSTSSETLQSDSTPTENLQLNSTSSENLQSDSTSSENLQSDSTSSENMQPSATPSTSNSNQSSILLTSDKLIALNAEIRWALKTVYSHYSYRSNQDNNLLFRAMAPGYAPFEFYQMSCTKVAYTILHGIAPVFYADLVSRVKR